MKLFKPFGLKYLLQNYKNIVCGIIYRQHSSPDQFMSYFEETIEKLTSLNKNVFIMGDFNIDLLKWKHLKLAMTS